MNKAVIVNTSSYALFGNHFSDDDYEIIHHGDAVVHFAYHRDGD